MEFFDTGTVGHRDRVKMLDLLSKSAVTTWEAKNNGVRYPSQAVRELKLAGAVIFAELVPYGHTTMAEYTMHSGGD